MTRLAV
jgi:acyl-homoserine lactone acylase PvdQ